MNIIEIKNLNYSYKNKKIFENLNLNISEGTFLFIAGSCGCGKTTLVKILLGLIETDCDITICGKKLNKSNLKNIRKEIGVVFENPANTFISETVRDEIAFSLKNLNENKTIIDEKVLEIAKLLDIENLLDLSPNNLCGGEQELVSLASALIIEPKILFIDEALSMLDGVQKENVFKLLKKINKDKKTTIIVITQDIDITLYGKELVIINNGNIVLNSKIKSAFDDEKIFKQCNLEIPFMVSLSNKLKYYELIDEIILDMDKMVNKLWK